MKFENRAFKLLSTLLILSSCGFNNNIKYGFSGSFSEHIVPIVRTACVGKKTQNTNNILFEVYAGHQDTFVDEWNNNIFGFNPGVGCFAINRVILNKDNIVISNEFVSLPDFPSKKYIFTFNNKNHNLYTITYNYSFIDSFSIPKNILFGHLKYNIVLIDNDTIIENVFTFGQMFASLNFEVKDSKCSFGM